MADLQESLSVSQYILSSLSKGMRREQIQTDLLAKGHDERFVIEILQETIKLHYNKLRAQGLKLILIGAFVCFISCLLTLTASITHINSHLVLYGLTSIGIVVIFIGLMKVF